MRRNEYTHRRRHISNRHLSDKYYYAGEHETATGIRLTQYNEQSLHTKEVRITDTSFSKLSDPDQINWFEVSGRKASSNPLPFFRMFSMLDSSAL